MENKVLRISFYPITVEQAIDIAKRFDFIFKNYIFVKNYSELKSAILFYDEKIMDFFPNDYRQDVYNKHEFIGDISGTKRLKEIELLLDLSNGKIK